MKEAGPKEARGHIRSTLTKFAICFLLISLPLACRAAPTLSDSIKNGRTFLSNLFNPNLNLLPEYRGAHVYWLYHDNYLAAKVFASTHPDIAAKIRSAITLDDPHNPDKIRLLFGEAQNPLPFREYELKDVRRVGHKLIRTETTTDRPLDGWDQYADLLLLASIAETNSSASQSDWNAAMSMWDGHGFLDAVAKSDGHYATYKLALALLAADHCGTTAKLPPGLVDKLIAMQDKSGGWITDYDATGKPLGLANVETTCYAILGLEALSAHRNISPP